jgi:hypothetical protein
MRPFRAAMMPVNHVRYSDGLAINMNWQANTQITRIHVLSALDVN